MFKLFKRLEFYIVLLGVLVNVQMLWWLIFFDQNQKEYFHLLEQYDLIILKILDQKALENVPEYVYFDKTQKSYKVDEAISLQRKEKLKRRRFMLFSEAFFFISVFIIISILILKFYYKQIQLLKEKDIFLNSFTHELKTPITAIKLNLQTLRKKINNSKLVPFIQTSIHELEILNNKISKILYSKDLKIELKTRENLVNLKEILQVIQKEIKNEFSHKKVHIDIKSSINIESVVKLRIPSSWLYFVLKEIFTNSMKYSDSNVEIKIYINFIKKFFKEYVLIKIQDNGWGLPENFVQDKFFAFSMGRFHISTNHSVLDGSGLGLYYIQQILKISGSKMEMRNVKKGLETNLFILKK